MKVIKFETGVKLVRYVISREYGASFDGVEGGNGAFAAPKSKQIHPQPFGRLEANAPDNRLGTILVNCAGVEPILHAHFQVEPVRQRVAELHTGGRAIAREEP